MFHLLGINFVYYRTNRSKQKENIFYGSKSKEDTNEMLLYRINMVYQEMNHKKNNLT